MVRLVFCIFIIKKCLTILCGKCIPVSFFLFLSLLHHTIIHLHPRSLHVDNVKIISGDAVGEIRIWDADDYDCLRVVRQAHVKAINTMQATRDMLVTGGNDKDVKIWELESSSRRPYKYVTCLHRLRGGYNHPGHQATITCMKFVSNELVTGDGSGCIIRWDLDTGEMVKKIENLHESAVLCIQFDVTRIITGSSDDTIRITDIATGELMQTLRGHTADVVSLQFDTQQILSVSRDGHLRHWSWQKRGKEQISRKYHLLNHGESLKTLKDKYGSSIKDMKKWNKIEDLALDMWNGMQVIVREGRSGSVRDRIKYRNHERDIAREKAKRIQARATRAADADSGNVLFQASFTGGDSAKSTAIAGYMDDSKDNGDANSNRKHTAASQAALNAMPDGHQGAAKGGGDLNPMTAMLSAAEKTEALVKNVGVVTNIAAEEYGKVLAQTVGKQMADKLDSVGDLFEDDAQIAKDLHKMADKIHAHAE